MAHKKAGGSKARQGGNRAGKRRGVKKYGGQAVKVGQIILRQLGMVYKAGSNVGVGKDYTLFALKEGVVTFKKTSKNASKVSVN